MCFFKVLFRIKFSLCLKYNILLINIEFKNIIKLNNKYTSKNKHEKHCGSALIVVFVGVNYYNYLTNKYYINI